MAEIINTLKLKKSGPCSDLQGLFFEYLSLFYRQVYGVFVLEPLPSSVLGNGENVDLLKLFLAVGERGGYEEVSKSGLWEVVAVECGFSSNGISKLKLVYFKYLDLLYRWLRRTGKREDSECEIIDKFSYLISVAMELGSGSGFKGLFCELGENKKKKGGECSSEEGKSDLVLKDNVKLSSSVENCGGSELKKDGECSTEEGKSDLVLKDNVKLSSSVENCGGSELKGVMSSVDDKSVVEDHTGGKSEHTGNNGGASNTVSLDNFSAESVKDNDFLSESIDTEENECNKKRKRENDSGFLKWISIVARDPCNQAIASLPERSKWKSHGSEHLWKQVLLVREALFLKPSHPNWKNKPMHPAMFEDSVLRCGQRMDASQRMASMESRKKLQHIFNVRMSGTGQDSPYRFWFDEQFSVEGSIQVGQEFQANVPEWKGEIEESDPKWLGSQIWPNETKERNIHVIERERIGKGRQDTCGCEFSGSSECVSFHISEKRKRVKLELGAAYYGWKFDEMGEQDAHLWTKEDEQRFHDTMKSTPLSKGFRLFKELRKIFPRKNMASLVRYYFNVYILQCRAHQNRTIPYDIDSDDDGKNGKIRKGNKGNS